jgi:sulfur carrier protein
LNITVNGEQKSVSDGTTVAELLNQLELQPRYVAVERNKILVPRTRHADCILQADDDLEIVTLVGGG